jgi:hypothetical protein
MDFYGFLITRVGVMVREVFYGLNFKFLVLNKIDLDFYYCFFYNLLIEIKFVFVFFMF